MTARVRAADPATLFRGGGKTIADHMAAVLVPDWVPIRLYPFYQLDAVLYDEETAAHNAREELQAARRCA